MRLTHTSTGDEIACSNSLKKHALKRLRNKETEFGFNQIFVFSSFCLLKTETAKVVVEEDMDLCELILYILKVVRIIFLV